jgi:hypothetical protein
VLRPMGCSLPSGSRGLAFTARNRRPRGVVADGKPRLRLVVDCLELGDAPHKLARAVNGGTRKAWQSAALSLLVLGMMVAGIVIVGTHDFVLVPNFPRR